MHHTFYKCRTPASEKLAIEWSKHAPWVPLFETQVAIGLLATVSVTSRETNVSLSVRRRVATPERTNIWPAVLSSRDLGEFAR